MALLSGLLGDATSALGDANVSADLGVGITHDISVGVAGLSVGATGGVVESVSAGLDTGGLLGSGGLVDGLLGTGGGLLGGIV